MFCERRRNASRQSRARNLMQRRTNGVTFLSRGRVLNVPRVSLVLVSAFPSSSLPCALLPSSLRRSLPNLSFSLVTFVNGRIIHENTREGEEDTTVRLSVQGVRTSRALRGRGGGGNTTTSASYGAQKRKERESQYERGAGQDATRHQEREAETSTNFLGLSWEECPHDRFLQLVARGGSRLWRGSEEVRARGSKRNETRREVETYA